MMKPRKGCGGKETPRLKEICTIKDRSVLHWHSKKGCHTQRSNPYKLPACEEDARVFYS